ncbi:Long chain acyl-CoA synthetase 8 [Sesamum angolense]|uniref:Long chain acyl-CoA synthetase 8 n=1 Tax=Sesamum angolense TaxID=2727404 RepID=A0AAE2BU73_9LAMI|nr:Long chain acyl-CoA synthetase 8 [Sesamum angolense]
MHLKMRLRFVILWPQWLVEWEKELVSWGEGGYTIQDKPMPRGEIVVGGPSLTDGYFNNNSKTREGFEVDDRGMWWFYTGDIGRGVLCVIVQCIKDMLRHFFCEVIAGVEAALISTNYVDNIMGTRISPSCVEKQTLKLRFNIHLSRLQRSRNSTRFEFPAKIQLVPEPWTRNLA